MKYTIYLISLLLLITLTTTVLSEHQEKHSGQSSHLAGDEKAHHLKKSGKKYSHEHEKAQKGKSLIVNHKKEEAEKGGKKHHAIDEDSHQIQSHDQGHAGHHAGHKHADKQKKTGFVKGFRDQYHKDEEKKSDSWYSNRHKSGEWQKFGAGKSKKHHVYKHDKDARGKYQSAKHSDKHMKEQKYAGGHSKADHKGHASQHGGQTHHAKHEEYAKKKNYGHGK